jgi:hypothetical protein
MSRSTPQRAGQLAEGGGDRSTEAPVVLVLGMHRSGTSLLARVVNLCGVPTDAEDQLMKPSRDNERGYWEPQYLAEINDGILEVGGGSWCDPPISGVEVGPPSPELARRIRECIRPWTATGASWVWKDPRLTVTLPAWLPELPPAVALISVRNPRAIWHSLHKRDRFPRFPTYLLWEIYMRAAVRHTETLRRLFVPYEDLIDQPRRTVELVASFLRTAGAIFDRAPTLDPAQQECMMGLQHHRSPPEAFFEDEAATESQKDLYRALLSAAPEAPPEVPGAMTTPLPMVQELLGQLEDRHRQALRAQLEEDRFLVLDGKLSDECHIAHRRFKVLDDKLGQERAAANDRFGAMQNMLARTADEIAELRHRLQEQWSRRPSWEIKLGPFRLRLYRDRPPNQRSATARPNDSQKAPSEAADGAGDSCR